MPWDWVRYDAYYDQGYYRNDDLPYYDDKGSHDYDYGGDDYDDCYDDTGHSFANAVSGHDM